MNLPVQLQENEVVARVIKRHPLALLGRLLAVALLLALVLVLWFWLRSVGGWVTTALDIGAALIAFTALAYAGFHWYQYENDLWIVTNQRLIDSTKSTPFSQDIKTATLFNLQDINIQKRGIFQTIFEYGDIICQTASASGQTFTFRGVSKPAEILDLIDDQRFALQRSNPQGPSTNPLNG